MYVLLSDLNALIFLSIVLEIEIYIEIIKKIQNIYFFLSPQENSVQLTFTFVLKSRSIQCCDYPCLQSALYSIFLPPSTTELLEKPQWEP